MPSAQREESDAVEMNLSRSPQTLTHSRPMTAGQAWGKVVLQVEVTAAVALRLQAERGYAYVCNREMHNKVCPLRIRAESDSWAAVQHHVSDCLNGTSVSAAGGE